MNNCYIRFGYPEKRNFLKHTTDFAEWHKMEDRLRILHNLLHRFRGISYSGTLHSFCWPAACPHMLHSFNAIPFGKCDFVLTYETSLPRQGGLPKFLIKWVWKKLASKQCRGILSLSGCSLERLLKDMEENVGGVSLKVIEAIKAKLEVLHPPQEKLIECVDPDRYLSGPLRLALVGHDFYRKGGLEVLIAMDRLVDEGKDIELAVAGKMVAGDYASQAGKKEVSRAEALMEKMKGRVRRLGSVPSDQVLDLLKESHVLCLPTWGDTYGYSVLEGQAAGCPAITSNIRALPEVNDSSCGWVVKVPKREGGDGDLDTEEKREVFREVLVEGIESSLREACDDRGLLVCKAQASLERIAHKHSPEKHASRLMEIYRVDKW